MGDDVIHTIASKSIVISVLNICSKILQNLVDVWSGTGLSKSQKEH